MDEIGHHIPVPNHASEELFCKLIILFILDPSGHCGYPMEVQLHLRDEVAGMVDVPMIVVANKSDLVGGVGYMTMSTQTGDGVEAVLAEILVHKPEPEARKRRIAVDIRTPLRLEPEDPDMDEDFDSEEKEKKPKKKRLHRKPRTTRAGMENPEIINVVSPAHR